jgi:general secretion pathway protein M
MLNIPSTDGAVPPVAPSRALWRMGIVDWLGRFPVLERTRTEFGLWWGNRTPRERRLLMALAGTATLVLIVFVIYRPLADTRAKAAADIHTYEVLAAQLRAAGPELARLRAVNRGGSPEIVTSSASGYGLSIGRMTPEEGLIRVWLQDADFSRLIQWLVQLETTTMLRVSEIRMERRAAPGLVNAQITLKK